MIRDASLVARLVAGIWFGDLSRSVTGSRRRAKAVLLAVAVAAAGWTALAIVTAPSSAPVAEVPDRVRLQLLGELIAGSALAAGCAFSVLTVLTPSSRELTTLLATAPIRRGSRALGATAAPVALASAAAPLVLLPISTASIGVTGGGMTGPVVVGGLVGAATGALLLAALIRLAMLGLVRAGLPASVATSVAAGAALALTAAAYVAGSRREWIASLPGDSGTQTGLALTATVLIGLIACGTLVVAVRHAPEIDPAPLVRWLPTRAGRSATGSLGVALLQTVRSPFVVSTLALASGALALTFGLTPKESPAWPTVMLLLLAAVPSAVTMLTYGIDRRTLWMYRAVLPPESERRGRVTLLSAGLQASALAALVAAIGSVAGHAAETPWRLALPCALLAASASLLSGVHFPFDLELPGAPVIALIEGAALTALPLAALARLADPRMQALGLLTAAAVCTSLVPASIAARRRRSIAG